MAMRQAAEFRVQILCLLTRARELQPVTQRPWMIPARRLRTFGKVQDAGAFLSLATQARSCLSETLCWTQGLFCFAAESMTPVAIWVQGRTRSRDQLVVVTIDKAVKWIRIVYQRLDDVARK